MIGANLILQRFNELEQLYKLDDNFFMTEICAADFPDRPVLNSMYQCCLCRKGCSESRVNLNTVRQHPATISIVTPNQFIEVQRVSDDFKGTLIAFSQDFFNSLGFPYSFRTANVINVNPVVNLSPNEEKAFINYTGMIQRILSHSRPYAGDIIRHLTAALIYSMADSVVSTLPAGMTHDEAIARDYITRVSAGYRDKRKVTDYAADLGLTPGYLSAIVKSVSGKSAAEWIDNYVMLEAKTLLASTDLTVQQVCHRLNFPNQSFFGKYFKRHSGMSPTQYRESL